jgi:hypothetical protein
LASPYEEIAMPEPRAPGRQNEYEQERRPARDGEPPRPAQEPPGSEGSSNSGETETDPATGEPNP